MAIEIGSVVEGTVTGITNFGAFIELPEGKVGLVHISEVADEYVKDVHDFLTEQDKVKVKILTIDERGKIGLSVKQAQEKKAEEVRPPVEFKRPPKRPNRGFSRPGSGRYGQTSASFEDKLSKFLKDSDEKQLTLRRKGGDTGRSRRGARRPD